MKAWVLKNLESVSWDRIGLGLSMVCAIHCLLTPLIILSIPFLARYYLAHPLIHLLLAILILPVGLVAFFSGYRHHRNPWILAMALPGLFLVSTVPYFVHQLHWSLREPPLMVLGSFLLIVAHWKNLKSCRSCGHRH